MSAIEYERLNIVSKPSKRRRVRNSFGGTPGRKENPAASSDPVSSEGPSARLKFILSEASNLPTDPGSSRIIYTDDCLRDYYFLRKEGVRFLNEPTYTTGGLAAGFIDFSGNTYMLVEERNYTED
jgi:hypothetical protein